MTARPLHHPLSGRTTGAISETMDDGLATLPAADAGRRPGVRPRQGLVGLALCAAVVGSWLALHVVAVFLLPLTAGTLPLVPLVILVQCWLSVGAFIVAHDAMHGSLVPFRPRLNAAIGGAILLLYAGFAWRRVRAAHMAHHRAPGTAEDPDFHAGDPRSFWPWFGTFFMRYFGLGSILFVSTVVTVYLAVLKAPIANVVLFYAVPALGSALQLFYFGTYRPHRHEDDGFPDRHNARTSELSWLPSLITCFHFGYHHEHHLTPSVPWWALPAERRRRAAAAGPDVVPHAS